MIESIKLTSDGLGIDLDYRILLKNLPELYNQVDHFDIDSLINPDLNYPFWDKQVSDWIGLDKTNDTISVIDLNKLPNFEEEIKVNWLHLKKRDYNYQWRLHSFDFLPVLVNAYFYTQDIKYINLIFENLISWKKEFIDSFNESEIFPWNDHASANRLLNLSYFLFFLRKNSYGNQNNMTILKNIILVHGFVLACRNFYSYHTNHGVFQAHHTYVASTLLKNTSNGVDFQELNFNRLREEFNFAFSIEFVHKENSPEYHLVLFKNFLHFNDNLKRLENISKEFIPNVGKFIAGSLKFLAYAIKPNGFLPTIGDTEEKSLDSLAYLKGEQNFDLYLYAQSKGKEGSSFKHLACAFEDAGYFFIKTNYTDIKYADQFYLAAKSGFLSKYHRQDDDCHFVLSAYGEDWLVDGGLYRHEHHDPIREYMRSRYSHNLFMPLGDVYVERQLPPSAEQQVNWGLTQWLVSSERIKAELSSRMFAGFEYKRTFDYLKPYCLTITDSIEKLSDNGINNYGLVYHFPNDKIVTIDNDNHIIVESDNAVMHMEIIPQQSTQKIRFCRGSDLPDVFVQKISKKYNQLEDCQTVVIELCIKDEVKKVSVQTNLNVEKKQFNVFILGSCVTRDAFEMPDNKKMTIAEYLARTSIASSFQDKPITEFDLSLIKSSFQRRMVENDLLKTTIKKLNSVEFDYLVIDLIDERFELAKDQWGRAFTLSAEFKDNIAIPEDVSKLSPNSNEFFDYWCKGWDKFLDFAKSNNFLNKIVINKVYWSNTDENGEVVFPEYEQWIMRNNQWLNRLYDYIEKSSSKIHIITYPANSFKLNRMHKWGVQPYHYADSFYLMFLSKLNEINKK